jgi:hypothetical protein
LHHLNPFNIREVKLPNFTQYILYFDDATIILNLHKIAIRIHDIICEDTEEAHFETLSKALQYTDALRGIGVDTENITLEPAHYARVESLLADALSRINERYFVDLGDGRKFWIDNSDTLEDETNDSEVREKIDNMVQSAVDTDVDFHDLDKLIEVVSGLVKLRVLDHSFLLHPSRVIEKSEYIG